MKVQLLGYGGSFVLRKVTLSIGRKVMKVELTSGV